MDDLCALITVVAGLRLELLEVSFADKLRSRLPRSLLLGLWNWMLIACVDFLVAITFRFQRRGLQ